MNNNSLFLLQPNITTIKAAFYNITISKILQMLIELLPNNFKSNFTIAIRIITNAIRYNVSIYLATVCIHTAFEFIKTNATAVMF